MLRAVTPGGHPAITALWLLGLALVALAAAVLVLGAITNAELLALGAIVVLVAASIAYQLRLRRFTATLVATEEALDAGDTKRARDLMAPLLARFHTFPLVQEVAADVLYAAGDPLSAAALWETAMKRLGAPRIAPRLVAAYAALNRGGDARRVAALVPNDSLAKLAAMRRAVPTPHDAAFLGYLAGIALRESGDIDEARREFSVAVERSPESIGGALARRERAHLPT